MIRPIEDMRGGGLWLGLSDVAGMVPCVMDNYGFLQRVQVEEALYFFTQGLGDA